MSKIFSAVVLALVAVSSVTAVAIPRATPPQGWRADLLEPYDTYNARYIALACQTQHSQAFFDACCHPLKQGETLENNRAAECVPNSPAYISAMVAEAPAPSSTGDDDDCSDDEPSSTPASIPSSTPATSTVPKPENTTTTTPATSTTPKPETTTSHTSSTHTSTPPATTTSSSGGGGTFTDGVATYFTQNGNAGACGTVHADSDLIAAIDQDRYGNTGERSSLCGQQVHITNSKNGKSVVVTIVDACPTCLNKNSIDLSVGAFTKIATEEEGEVDISWYFL